MGSNKSGANGPDTGSGITVKKIILGVLLPAIVLTGIFAATQMAKGATGGAALGFAVQWAAITLVIFHGVRAGYRRSGQHCKVEKLDS